jgi:hypothetical protein
MCIADTLQAGHHGVIDHVYDVLCIEGADYSISSTCELSSKERSITAWSRCPGSVLREVDR